MIGLPIKQRFKNLSTLGPITVPYGGSTKYERFHPAVDIANVKGTPIGSPVTGKVLDAVGGKKQGDEGFGNKITIQTPNGDKIQFGHLDQVEVLKGQKVKKGQQIATIGNSGGAYSPSKMGDGSHLDFRIVSAFGRYRNPMIYLNHLTPR